MRRVNDLAIEVGQAVHRPDEGLLDRAGGLVGAHVQIGTAILRGSGAALDELACRFRDFKLVLKPAKRLRKRLVGRGAGLDRGLRRPFLLLRHLTSPSSLRANGDPVRYRPEEYSTLARFMLHCNMNWCIAHNCDRGEKLIEPQRVNGAGARRSMAAALSPCPPAPKERADRARAGDGAMGDADSSQGRKALTAAALDPHDRARLRELKRTKWVAGGVLVASLTVLVVAKLLERHDPGFGFLAAFAEAATIGGLADWYAVVVLFRRPLGLPIPHTAIIPANHREIAERLW